jgi:hypothetical protein
MPRNVKTSRAGLWWIVTGIGLFAAGCGDSLAPDRLDDEPLPCGPLTTTFKLDHANPSARVAQSIDLDGDHRPDDALGRAHDLIAAFAPDFAVSERFGARLATDVAWSVTVDQCEGNVRVTIGPDGTGRAHLPRAAGRISADGQLDATDGQAQLPLLALADATDTITDPGWRIGDAVTLQATLTGDTLSGVFAMALPTETVKADLAAPIAAFLTAQPPTQAMRVITDADHDNVVTATEVTATSTYQGMTQSDLTLVLDDRAQTSIAFQFTATAVR